MMKNTYRKVHTLALLIIPICAHSLEIKTEAGYDTNPFELSGKVDGGMFTNLLVSHKGKKNVSEKSEFQYRANLSSRFYEKAFEDADNHRINLFGRFVHRFMIGERSANLLVTGDWRSDRRTYFSQSQRALATSRGNSISDRFDNDTAKLSAELIYRLDRKHSIALYSSLSGRNYLEDYEEIGLESLDNYEYSFQPTYRYKNNEIGLRGRAFVYYRNRLYEDLLEDDALGTNIADNKLRYSFYGYGVTATKSVTEKLSINAYANGYFARDDSSGFRDFDFHQLRLGLDYQISEVRKLSAQGSCYIRDFLLDVASPVESETGAAGRLRKGCKAEAEYSAPFIKLNNEQLRWQAKIGTEVETNSAQNLSFDKFYALFSISYEF